MPGNMPPVRDYRLGDTLVRYLHDPESGAVGLSLLPASLAGAALPARPDLRALPCVEALAIPQRVKTRQILSLAPVKLAGTPYAWGFSQGVSLLGAEPGFRFARQEIEGETDAQVILTELCHPEGLRLEHRLRRIPGTEALEIVVTFHNDSAAPVTLELLGSFCVADITPFAADDAPGRLRAHRLRSWWSAEGRLCTETIEQLHLERSWLGVSAQSERFGQIGTMPVRRWFPFVALEDTAAGVIWAAQLAWAGSWEMEIFRKHDDLALTGGLADREFGHWSPTVPPGGRLVAPPALLTCVAGGLDAACARLTAAHPALAPVEPAAVGRPPREARLPVIFNEWCATWGNPSHDRIVALAAALRGTGVRYLVIDAGWYQPEGGDWDSGHGDWIPSKRLFPEGLKAVADAIRAHGLVPGIWFEFETCGSKSELFGRKDWLLRRDGRPVTSGGRRFLDFSLPAVRAYLEERMVRLLEECGFGYLKVDYNETLGLGCAHPNGLGEGLRAHVESVYSFFEHLRARLPGLVIESCSSGGHRLEPSMVARTDLSSFSDAHETPDIPVIGLALHRAMPPAKILMWAVLRPADDATRLGYSLAAGCLGRLCLSGDLTALSAEQTAVWKVAVHFHAEIAPVLMAGVSTLHDHTGPSRRQLTGWQALVRVATDGESALVVVHAFEGAPARLEVPLPSGAWRIASALEPLGLGARVEGDRLKLNAPRAFIGGAWLLEAKAGSQPRADNIF